jgi:hypothetical protein
MANSLPMKNAREAREMGGNHRLSVRASGMVE